MESEHFFDPRISHYKPMHKIKVNLYIKIFHIYFYVKLQQSRSISQITASTTLLLL